MATTVAPHALYGMYALIGPYFKTDKIGGVVGDANHGSGYHLSRDALKARGLTGDYSIQCPADKRGPGNAASAIDITFGSLAELVTVTKRLRAACEAKDPRVEPLREHIGTIDGKNVCGYNRVATGSGSRSRVGWTSTGFSDKSHLWHAHLSVLRAYCDDVNSIRGLAEVVAGVKSGTLSWTGDGWAPQPAPVPPKPTGYPKPLDKVVYVSKLTPGQADSDSVWWAQKALGVPLTGTYDKATVDAVKAFQASLGDDVDGDLGPLEAAALFGRHPELGVTIEAKP